MFIDYLMSHNLEIKKKSHKKLLVFKGFTYEDMKKIPYNKLLSLSMDCSIQELNSSKPISLMEAITKGAKDKESIEWATFEELLMLDWNILKMYFDITVIKNNLYHISFPLVYKIDNITELYSFLSEDEPEENDNGNNTVSIVKQYYGNYELISKQPFITFTELLEDIDEIDFYPFSILDPISIQSTYLDTAIELSEDESSFLEFTQKVVSNSLPVGLINVAFSGDIISHPNRYINRLRVIQEIYKDLYKIKLISKKIEAKANLDDSEYLRILNIYWKHNNFRKIRIYENIHEVKYTKKTVEVLQSQIIDDIVKQAERAYNEETYRDIFVTSPTGAGKSVMFQIPAIYLAEKYKAITIVISPLIGLMNDQVEGLESRNVQMSATINSSISPVEKIQISEKIKNGEVNILYISPETLLSRSDISILIGERPIGLFVIDEAHIVTTWGKAFRSDYWYLGNYLEKMRKDKRFPIATFTATAIYGGIEDMYSETRDSLGLNNPISYFGYLKRDNLQIRIKKQDNGSEKKYKEYLAEKKKIMLVRLEKFVGEDKKTLVYFPLIRFIHDFYDYCKLYGSPKLIDTMTKYYGSLNKEEKNSNYLSYKFGESKIMLATKAFGMGIDIPDIENVYHFAPTGNVCDYIQEIGRAARDLDFGYAYFDFLPKDFVHVQRLHGISTIRKNQLTQVIKKVLVLIDKQRGSNIRNILVSADEFRYIFQSSNQEEENIDHKVKTSLLIIEKDFNLKVRYSPLVARPRSVFAKEFFIINSEVWNAIPVKFKKYFNMLRSLQDDLSNRNIYTCDMKEMWLENFNNVSYPKFKRSFFNGNYEKNIPFSNQIMSVIKIELDIKSADESKFISEIQNWTQSIADWFSDFAMQKSYFSTTDLAKKIKMNYNYSTYASENLAEIILNSAHSYDRMMRRKNNFYNMFLKYDVDRKGKEYYFTSSGYASFMDWIVSETIKILKNKNTIKKNNQQYEVFTSKSFGADQEQAFIHLGLLEALGILVYQVHGGDNPEIYIRINSKAHLERIVENPDLYNNRILENVRNRHKVSVAMLNYIFKKEVDTDTFWELIEDYFLGTIPEEVINEANNKYI